MSPEPDSKFRRASAIARFGLPDVATSDLLEADVPSLHVSGWCRDCVGIAVSLHSSASSPCSSLFCH